MKIHINEFKRQSVKLVFTLRIIRQLKLEATLKIFSKRLNNIVNIYLQQVPILVKYDWF